MVLVFYQFYGFRDFSGVTGYRGSQFDKVDSTCMFP